MAKAALPAGSKEVTSAKVLKALLASSRSAQNDISEIGSTYGTEVKRAVEKNHLHRKAYNVVRMLDRMEPDKLADFMENFEHYCEATGLNARAASAPRMDMGEKDKTENEADEEEQTRAAKGNVKNFPTPAGNA